MAQTYMLTTIVLPEMGPLTSQLCISLFLQQTVLESGVVHRVMVSIIIMYVVTKR